MLRSAVWFPPALVLLALFTAACESPGANAPAAKVELPEECSSYVSTLETCLRTNSVKNDAISAARKEQAQAALLAEATRDPAGIMQLRTKCIGAHERLS